MMVSSDGQARGVVCVGQAVLDRIYSVDAIPSTPAKVRARHLLEVGGGIAANAAVAIARLGGPVALWSRVGDDLAGAAIAQGLADEAVDVANVRRFPHARSSTSAVVVNPAGERLIVNDPGLALEPDAHWLPLSDLTAARVGCVLADARWPEGALAAFAAARTAGIPTVLDADTGALRLTDLLPLADYAIFAESALAELVGVSREPEAMDSAGIYRALEQVRALGARHAGVTMGAQGYLWLGIDGQAAAQPAFAVQIVDTTGAGDAFHGAFAWAVAQGSDEAHAARTAAAVAALKCTQAGGRAALPKWEQVRQFLSGSPSAPLVPRRTPPLTQT